MQLLPTGMVYPIYRVEHKEQFEPVSYTHLLISDIERHYKEICKERGIDPLAKAEPETAPIEQPEDAAKVADRQPTGNLDVYKRQGYDWP